MSKNNQQRDSGHRPPNAPAPPLPIKVAPTTTQPFRAPGTSAQGTPRSGVESPKGGRPAKR